MTGSVTFDVAIGGDGSTVTDDDNATTGLRDGGWRTRFVPCFTNQVSIANYVVTKANEAAASQTAAANSATAAAASYDSFDDRYLGAKSSNPTVDNDGNALLTGALYWNTVSNQMRVYSGSAWEVAYISGAGYLALSGGTMTGAITFASGQFGTNVNTFLTTPSSANLAAALTDETGSGALVFADTPTLIAPILGTPTSGTLTNCTGYTYANLSGTVPTWNQNTTGTAANVTGLVAVANGGTGTATPSLVGGSNVTVTGTWPNQTIAATGGGGSATKTISNKTAAYTIVSGDLGTIINCTSGTFTVSLTAAASLGSGFTCTIWNTGTGDITIDPNATETIDGVTTLILRQGEGTDIVCNGTNWETSYKKTMRGYAENFANNTPRPIVTGNAAFAIGYGASVTNNNAIALGYQASCSGNASIALGKGCTSSVAYGVTIGDNSAGNGSQAVTGAGAMALGGSYASGADSFAAAIANNTSTYGAQGTTSIAMGNQAKASGALYSIAIGDTALASGTRGVAIGSNNTASAAYSSALGGHLNIAAGMYSVAMGGYASSSQQGKYSMAAGQFGAQGDAQYGLIVLRASTTTTTAVVLTSDAGAAGTTNQLILASNQAMAISGTLIAKQSASGNMAGWAITGIVSNNAGTMTVSGLALTAIGTDSIGLGAAPTIAVDSTNKGVTITSGYKAATNIRWVANLQTSEVTYA